MQLGLSPMVVIPNKNGKLRICVDFRKFNAITKKDFQGHQPFTLYGQGHQPFTLNGQGRQHCGCS
jgi:hypothetical protein